MKITDFAQSKWNQIAHHKNKKKGTYQGVSYQNYWQYVTELNLSCFLDFTAYKEPEVLSVLTEKDICAAALSEPMTAIWVLQ